MTFHHVKITETIKELAMKYFQRESNRTSLMTITSVNLFDRDSKAIILFTVLPENREHTALDFAKRKRAEFRDFIKANARLRVIPFIDFEIDMGEKNRQRMDELTIVASDAGKSMTERIAASEPETPAKAEPKEKVTRIRKIKEISEGTKGKVVKKRKNSVKVVKLKEDED